MMISSFYRLPIGVECFRKEGKIYVSGVKGKVVFNSVSNLYRKGNMVVILPYLTPYFNSIFKQAVQGVLLGYTIKLSLKGIGYRVLKKNNNLVFFLGYSKAVILEIPEDIIVQIDKKTLFLRSANFGTLQNFATTIRRYRFPDSYKGQGVLYEGEVILCKEGKKT